MATKIHLLHSEKSLKASRKIFHTFQCNDLAGRVHDCAVSRNWPANGVAGIIHVNDDHLGLFPYLLPYADEFVRLHSQSAEANVGWINAQVLELEHIKEQVQSHPAVLSHPSCNSYTRIIYSQKHLIKHLQLTN